MIGVTDMAVLGEILVGNRKRARARRAAEPSFAADQLVSTTDVVRHWKDSVEPKLVDKEFIVMIYG